MYRYISSSYLLVMFSNIRIPLNVVVLSVNIVHGITQVTDEQIITIFHLVLQVYCSPSLKEHLHNPVMTLLARSIERKESILHVHGVVCACVCVVLCA